MSSLVSAPSPLSSYLARFSSPATQLALCAAVVVCLTGLRAIFATTIDLRVDEAYYWTWSRENVLSFLDHPPLIAWAIRLGTALFGDTLFGVRSPGLLAMLLMQLMIADIVWRTVRNVGCVIAAVLLSEASLGYGMLMSKITPDIVLIPCEFAMLWSLVRLTETGDRRWWLGAGFFGGLALLSKYTAILLLPAVAAFVLIPAWRMRQLSSPYPWLAVALALLVFSPVLYWNAIHDWASFRFQLNRPPQTAGVSALFLAEFLIQQLILIGAVTFPMAVIGAVMLALRGYRSRGPVAILLSSAFLIPLGLFAGYGLFSRVGDSWLIFAWPIAFACAAINFQQWRRKAPKTRLTEIAPAALGVTIVGGIASVVAAQLYYLVGSANVMEALDPIGKEAGFADVATAADQARAKAGATWFVTTDYRIYSMLRWELKDAVPVVQVNERSRYIDFRTPQFSGPVGLYVASTSDRRRAVWINQSVSLQPTGVADLIWRGARYDTYSFEKLRGWMPKLTPPPGDPLYVARPQ